MPAPFQHGATSNKSGGNRRPLHALSSSGEELGLVPSKYLKRFYSDDADDNNSTNNHQRSSMSSTTIGTPPRKPKLHQHDPMSPSPQQQQVLKDIETDDLPLRTPQERLVSQEELDRALMQKGAPIIKSSFVDEWKIACLRAEGYDVGRATVRIMHQWRLKSELFGTPDLKVTIGDVAPNLVHAGLIQLVPTRDLAGRCVVCMKFDPDVYSSQEREIKKYLFYMLASALEDEETQDKGIVLLVWNLQRISNSSSNIFAGATPPWGGFFDSFWNLWKSIKASYRIARLHYATVCNDGMRYTLKEYDESPSVSLSLSSSSSLENTTVMTTVVRHHTGSSQECLHALLTFGLPIACLPITPEKIETTHHHKWVEWRQRTDSYHHQHHYKIILVPTRYDVLFGKHSPINAGNIRFHQMILANVQEYRQSKSSEQAAMRTQIYKTLTSGFPAAHVPSAKCLQPLDTRWGILWEPMTEKLATAKIAEAFQYVIRQLDQQQQQQGDPSTDRNVNNHSSDLADFIWMKRCCFMITCKEGYHICGDSKEVSSQQW